MRETYKGPYSDLPSDIEPPPASEGVSFLGCPLEGEIAASKKQVGGSHYKDLKIQPFEYALANNLNYAQANVVKYVTRYKQKGGIQDLQKAIHNIELLIEWESKCD